MSTSSELDLGAVLEDETLFERRYRFLTQRNAGGTFRAIAERYNREAVKAAVDAGRDPSEAKTISPATVRKDIEWAKRDLIDSSTREHLIAEETVVLLDVRRANYAAMVNGDIDAAKIVLATVTQRRELWGLDAPKRSQIGVGTDVEFASDLVALIESIGADAPSDLVFAARGERVESSRDVMDVDTVPEIEPGPRPQDACPFDLDAPEPRRAPADSAPEPAPAAEPWSNL